jgi:hypothetical protein
MAANTRLILALGLLGQLTFGTASANEPATSGDGRQGVALAAPAGGEVKPLWLPQTREDWDSVVSKLDLAVHTTNGYEEVTVTAPADLIPMKVDVYDEMWGGILAPVWAILHPTQAWRILAPIPPR